MAYIDSMVIIETPIFTKQLLSNFSEEEYRLFQAALLERPDAGKVIPGGAGLRKLRWAVEGRGKRGGVRGSRHGEQFCSCSCIRRMFRTT
jgi:hypothetical protein